MPDEETKTVNNGICAEDEVLAGIRDAHAMVLGSLMGHGAAQLSRQMKNKKFRPDDILYVGLQGIHSYQEIFLKDMGVDYKVQDQAFISDNEIKAFMKRFNHILIHFDIDVLDELSDVLRLVSENSDVTGFTIAEYLPFDEYRLHKVFAGISLFTQ